MKGALRSSLPLVATACLGLWLRSGNLTSPYLLDAHSFRQGDTAGFALGYLIGSFNPLAPTTVRQPCRAGSTPRVESELPLPAWLAVLPLKLLGATYPPAWYLRSVWLLFYLGTCAYLYLLSRQLGASHALAGLVVFVLSVLPLAVFFTVSIQPDGPSLGIGAGLLYHLARWLEHKQTKDEVLLVALGATVLLVKVSNVYLALPALWLLVSQQGWPATFKQPRTWLWALLIATPGCAWYTYIHYTSSWTFVLWETGGYTKFSSFETFTSAAHWMRLSNRLVYQIFGWSGFVLAVLGASHGREQRILRVAAAWAGGFCVFLLAAMPANVTHNYYQLPLVVPAAFLIACGIAHLWQRPWKGRVGLAVLGLIFLASARHTLSRHSKRTEGGLYREKQGMYEAVTMLREHVPEGQRFIAIPGRPELFYNSNRRGFTGKDFSVRRVESCAKRLGSRFVYLMLDAANRKRARRIVLEHPEWAHRLQAIARGREWTLYRYENAI
ncbi:MAG: glycosyltransferase family 39 protein [Proteobacteria bacterium]|nr:glycosyltransferase family 39 protein [Pseudomonadota bacterium]